MKRKIIYGLIAVTAIGICFGASGADVSVDWNTVVGKVKPVNGVGQPPLKGNAGYSMFQYLKKAGIPYSRLHDVGGPYGRNIFVDIPNLFRDFDADETKPENYDFTFTDKLMEALVAHGVEPFFRLGITIENACKYKAYRTYPPKDFAKWARICEHVIRHYTEGWANGYKMKIEYWEIWNEPENHPVPELNPMFRAPFSEYIRLYGVTAPHLKAKFPHLKIGGYASSGFYAATGVGVPPGANVSARREYFVECAKQFLTAVKKGGWPLDFFSYHSYSEPKEALRQGLCVRRMLDEYGFKDVETSFNEWLPRPSLKNRGSMYQAAMIGAELIGLQNGPCDTAMIYDARCGGGNYSPLFNPLTEQPHKAYWVFVAFNELRKLGTAVKCVSCDEDLWATAAKGKEGKAVMLANYSERTIPLNIPGMTVDGCKIIDATRTWEDCAVPAEVAPHTVLVIMDRE